MLNFRFKLYVAAIALCLLGSFAALPLAAIAGAIEYHVPPGVVSVLPEYNDYVDDQGVVHGDSVSGTCAAPGDTSITFGVHPWTEVPGRIEVYDGDGKLIDQVTGPNDYVTVETSDDPTVLRYYWNLDDSAHEDYPIDYTGCLAPVVTTVPTTVPETTVPPTTAAVRVVEVTTSPPTVPVALDVTPTEEDVTVPVPEVGVAGVVVTAESADGSAVMVRARLLASTGPNWSVVLMGITGALALAAGLCMVTASKRREQKETV